MATKVNLRAMPKSEKSMDSAMVLEQRTFSSWNNMSELLINLIRIHHRPSYLLSLLTLDRGNFTRSRSESTKM